MLAGSGMGFLGWMGLIGLLLLVLALSSAYVRQLPLSTSIIYLAVGVALGPAMLDWVRLDLTEAAPWFERVTEVGVIVSLFVAGVKLRLPVTHPGWVAAYLMAGPLLLATILGVAAVGYFSLGLNAGTALLLGAVLAPTDPVLAGSVRVSQADDHDRLRYGLTGEAGLNDGAAFPFVVFAVNWTRHGGPGSWLAGWLLHRVVWAVPAGLALGYCLGKGLGRLAIWLRTRHRDVAAPNDFLALSLIALSYVASSLIGAWGFLAVFAAGVGLRHAEVEVVRAAPHPEASARRRDDRDGPPSHPPAEALVPQQVEEAALAQPAVAAGVVLAETLSFGDTVERLLEVLLVGIVGVSLARHWDPAALALAVALIAVIRPLATRLVLARAPVTPQQRRLMAWFGIRGIGSLYYLAYATGHGASGPAAAAVASLALPTIAVSILAHGATADYLLARYERTLGATGAESGDG